jgi:hypothetical protein
MALDNEQIIRRAYQLGEDMDMAMAAWGLRLHRGRHLYR